MFLKISSFYFFYFAIVGVYVIFLPKVLVTIGYTASQIGIIFAAAPLVRFLVPLFFIKGFSLDRTAFYIALWILALSGLSFFFTLWDFYLLLLTNIFFGVGLSLILPYIETISLHVIGKERYGKSRLFGSIGFMAVALVLVRFLNSPTVALVYLFLMITASIFFGYILIKDTDVVEQNGVRRYDDTNRFFVFQDWRLWVGFVLMQMSFGAFYNFFTIYETDQGIDMETTIYLWSFGVLMEIVMLYFQGMILQRYRLLLLIKVGIFSAVVRWLMLFWFGGEIIVVFVAQSLHALSFALFHSASISYLFHRYKNKALAQQLFLGFSYGLGALMGAVLAGFVYERFASFLFLVSAALAAVAFVFVASFSKTSDYTNACLR